MPMMAPNANQIRARMDELTVDREALRKHRDADPGIKTVFDLSLIHI